MNTTPVVLVDGHRTAMVPASDRGLQYGDGVWETMAVKHGKILCLREHLQRLLRGVVAVGLDACMVAAVKRDLRRLGRGVERAVIKVILTRGSSSRGYRSGQDTVGRRIVTLQPWPHWPATWQRRGIQVLLLKARLATQPGLSGYKHLNCLQQVLARKEWDSAAIAEGLMRDQLGYVVEGTMSNVFIRCGQRWLTPKIDRCGVAGIVREAVISHCQDIGIKIRQQRIKLSQLCTADEIFVCNSLIGLWPVRRLLLAGNDFDNRVDFAPGSFTRLIRRRLVASRAII
ncbi:MAG: aminodeoxychorismate lyase [Candidatus Porifericomitaceae bacterium WSBS_2022_MAG_OTU9]